MKRQIGDEKPEVYGEKIIKDQIVVVSLDEVLSKLLISNGYKVELFESAFDLVEQKPELLKNSLILVRNGINVPNDFVDYFEYEPKKEIKLINQIRKIYECQGEPEVINKEDILHTRVKKQ